MSRSLTLTPPSFPQSSPGLDTDKEVGVASLAKRPDLPAPSSRSEQVVSCIGLLSGCEYCEQNPIVDGVILQGFPIK